jgi:hypothetical protein
MPRALDGRMLPTAPRPRRSLRSRALLAALVGLALVTAAEPAAAQFTAAVTPPRRRPAPPPVMADGTRPDTIRPTVLSDLKAWVDSAAAGLSRPAPRDSAAAQRDSVAARRDSAAAPAPRPASPPRRPRTPPR